MTFIIRKVLLLLVIIPAVLSAQDLDRKISFSVKNSGLKEVINIISEKGDIHFSYNPQILSEGKKISTTFKNQSIREILNEILPDAGLEYVVVENQVVLKPIVKKPEEPAKKRELRKYTISGFLRDKFTGEPLIGANIYDKDTYTGTTTNAYGFYSLTLPEGIHTIMMSFISYEHREKLITLNENLQQSADLQPIHLEMKEVEVVSQRVHDAGGDQGFVIPASQMSALPGFAGEVDIIRSLQVVPGIQNYGDGSALFYVRGGNSDQNLIMIDDAPIFNPSHMFGFFSVLAPEAIRETDIYKGDFPAEYGGRLSSVIDIKAKNGNLKNFGCSGNIGPYASSLSVEGPVVKDKGSFFLSGRYSTINWLDFLNSTTTDFRINFYDLNAKLNYRLGAKDRVFTTFYYGSDAMDRKTGTSITTYGISWSNLAGIVRWNHNFNPKLFSNLTSYYSRYAYYLYTSEAQKQYWTSVMENLALKNDLTWYISPKNNLKAGFEVAYHHSNPGNVNFKFADNENSLKVISQYSAIDYAVYASDSWKIGKKIDLTIGLRLTLWQDIGPADVYYFDVNHEVIDTLHVKGHETYAWYLRPEPRINIRYALTSGSSVKFNYSRNTQFMQVISNSVSPFTSLEVWTFSGPNVNPRTSDQVCLGYYRNFYHSVLDLSASIYYKWITDNIDYQDHANLFYNPLLEGQLRKGTARSYGLELMLRKQSGKLTGWIAYTWSRAFINTPELNGGGDYPAFYDRPHDLSVNLAYASGHFSFSANWLMMSGAAITTPVGFYYLNGYSVPLYGKRNNDRLPMYHRLDLSLGYTISNTQKRFQHSIILTVYNAYGRNNPFSVSFNRMRSGEEFVVPSDLSGGYQLVPTTLSVAGIIPSLNYLFHF